MLALLAVAVPSGCPRELLTRPPAQLTLPEVMPFASWQSALGKSYTSAGETEHRRAVYQEHIQLITRHNRRHDENASSFRLGVNQYTDLTHAEFKRRFTTTAFPPAQPPHNSRVLDTAGVGDATVDWRTKGAVTPVKNQAKCGSVRGHPLIPGVVISLIASVVAHQCWAFSSTGAVEGAFQIATGELRSASEQQLADCSGAFGNHGCSGGLMDNAFKYIIANKGVDSEHDYTYVSGNGTGFSCWAQAASRAALTISNYSDVPRKNEAQLAAAVMLQPVSVAIEVRGGAAGARRVCAHPLPLPALKSREPWQAGPPGSPAPPPATPRPPHVRAVPNASAASLATHLCSHVRVVCVCVCVCVCMSAGRHASVPTLQQRRVRGRRLRREARPRRACGGTHRGRVHREGKVRAS
jgi:hypothetical protein